MHSEIDCFFTFGNSECVSGIMEIKLQYNFNCISCRCCSSGWLHEKRTYPKYSHSNATNTQIMFESRAILLTHGGSLRFRISETQIRFRYIYQWLKTPKNSNPSLASILQARFFLPLLFSFCISMQSQSLSLLLKWKFHPLYVSPF